MQDTQLESDQYHSIFEQCMEAVFVFDRQGKILTSNHAAKISTGFGENLSGRSIIEIFPRILNQKEGKISWNLDNKNTTLSTFAYRDNQTCFPVLVKLYEMGHGNHYNGICIAIDDSERSKALKNSNQALNDMKAVNKMKSEFMANITHELRTPINGMRGMAEGLLETDLTQRQAENVSIIMKCCDNMTKIINDLLDFAKIEAGKMTIEYHEFDLHKFLDETMAFNVGRIQEKGLKFIININPNIPKYVIGDELRTGQVLNNLLSNAVKFTTTGHIGFEVATTFISDMEVELLFMVIDTGIGIQSEEKDKLFKSFSQVDGSITRRFGGTGLGLAICRQLVDLMGGTIGVDSEKGKGSTFSFSIRFGVSHSESNCEGAAYPSGRFVYSKKAEKPPEAGFLPKNLGDWAELVPIDLYEIEHGVEENIRQIDDRLEKLMLCIQLEAWEKGEDFAAQIRNLIPQGEKEMEQAAFRLLLAVRKEDQLSSIDLAEHIQEGLSLPG